MAEITKIYKKTISVLVNENEFNDIKISLGICDDKNYIRLDESDFIDYDISLPYNIGDDIYDHIIGLFDNNKIDYVRIYK